MIQYAPPGYASYSVDSSGPQTQNGSSDPLLLISASPEEVLKVRNANNPATRDDPLTMRLAKTQGGLNLNAGQSHPRLVPEVNDISDRETYLSCRAALVSVA